MLDLTVVTLLSVEGIAAVVNAGYRAVKAGSTLVIRPSPQVVRRLRSVGFADLLAVHRHQPRPGRRQPTVYRTDGRLL